MSGFLARERIRARSDSIDTLRAVLALWVLVVHLAEWGPLSSTGRTGVVGSIDHWTVRLFQPHGETHPAVVAFIVLSGYCIHRGGGRIGGGWSTPAYATKRFFRIVPVYVAASFFGAALFLVARRYDAGTTTAITETAHISTQCMAAKLSGVAAFDPGLTTCAYQGNAPLATVMVEIWLYVVYGVAVWLLLRRFHDRALGVTIAVVYLIGVAFVARHPIDAGWWHNSSLVGYLLYWWIGASVVARGSRRPVYATGIAGALAWAAITVLTWNAHLSPRGAFLAAEAHKIAFALAVAALITALDIYVRQLPSLVAAFGRSGYSLYAFHAPIIVLVVALGWPWWIALLASLGLALGSYRFYERPLLVYGRRLAAARFAGGAVRATQPVAAEWSP